MKIDTFISLVSDIRKGQLVNDTDPNNTVIQQYASPYDTLSNTESVRVLSSKTSSLVWGDGKTYQAVDAQGNTYNAPSCGWTYGMNGRWN